MVFLQNAPKWGFLLGREFVKNSAEKTGGKGRILRYNRRELPKYHCYAFIFSKPVLLFFFVGGEAGGGGVRTRG